MTLVVTTAVLPGKHLLKIGFAGLFNL